MSGFDGNGNYIRAHNFVTDRNNQIKIVASRVDDEINAAAIAFTDCVTRDGQSPLTANMPAGGYKIINLGTPTLSTDAATKAYVDAAATPGIHATVVAATTANITISTLNDGTTLDGVTIHTGDNVLVKNQTTQSQNGVYTVGVSPARSSQFNTWNSHIGAVISVSGGTTNINTLWLCMVNSGGTLGTTAITFASAGTAVTLPLPLASGGLGVALTDPGADSIYFYQESTTQTKWLSPSSGVKISGTNLQLDINGLATKSAPLGGDFFALYDATGTVNSKAPGTSVALLGVADQALSGGAIVTPFNLGTQSSGTLTLDMGKCPMQYYTNGGAHTLAPGTNKGAVVLDITNNGTAGAITTSGWTKVSGDSLDTTNAHVFRCHCSVGQVGSLLVVQAMQ